MAFKQPNYGQERAARNRTKEMRKQEKLQKREEESAKRKALREAEGNANPEPEKS
jgi:hypothetical protein